MLFSVHSVHILKAVARTRETVRASLPERAREV